VSDAPVTILQHGTTLKRAQSIIAHGPDPNYKEPGTGQLPSADGFSTIIKGTTYCPTGMPIEQAHLKDNLFPDEGGPVILEVEVPERIMAIHLSNPDAVFVIRGGEIRFEAWCGLNELLAEWSNLVKRIIPV
jgi:hypothetical protein